jgi:hypothetical protein
VWVEISKSGRKLPNSNFIKHINIHVYCAARFVDKMSRNSTPSNQPNNVHVLTKSEKESEYFPFPIINKHSKVSIDPSFRPSGTPSSLCWLVFKYCKVRKNISLQQVRRSSTYCQSSNLNLCESRVKCALYASNFVIFFFHTDGIIFGRVLFFQKFYGV